MFLTHACVANVFHPAHNIIQLDHDHYPPQKQKGASCSSSRRVTCFTMSFANRRRPRGGEGGVRRGRGAFKCIEIQRHGGKGGGKTRIILLCPGIAIHFRVELVSSTCKGYTMISTQYVFSFRVRAEVHPSQDLVCSEYKT